jgi:hypothetical protein
MAHVGVNILCRAWHERHSSPRLDGPVPEQVENGNIFRSQGRVSPPPALVRKGELDGGNEVADGQENQAVGFHYGATPSGDMAPLRKLPNTAAFCGLRGCHHGDSGFKSFIKPRIDTHYAVNKRVTLGCERGGPEGHRKRKRDTNV